jgi:hypothetical protein
MFAQTLILAGLVLGAPNETSGPKLEKGLEILWKGTFSEASIRPGVRAVRDYDVDVRLFTLDTGEHGADAILFTRVFLKPDRKTSEPPAGIVRLDLIRIDPNGRVSVLPSPADPENPSQKARPWPLVQLQGLPTHESGVFVEFPGKPLKTGLVWSRDEAGRPPVTWKVANVDLPRPAGRQHRRRTEDGRLLRGSHSPGRVAAERQTHGAAGKRLRVASRARDRAARPGD